MEREPSRKDAPVADTIARIQGILDSLGFRRERAQLAWWSAGPDCHSCHLRFANYPLIFSNGKGFTRELAYASALAEFVERLQCRVDEFFTRAGNIYHLPFFEPRTRRSLAEISGHAPRIAAEDLGQLTPDDVGDLACLAFADVRGRRVVDLPIDVLRMMTGSTGMCAGNTPEEALTQGLCEVFERHAVRAVADGLVPGLPSMPLDTLRLGDGALRRQLESLRASGAAVIVKDASLGGAFPVVALVLVNRREGTCHVSFGSDPDFAIALSRCITEAFQGTDRMVRPLPPSDRAASSPDLFNHPEQLLDRLLDDVGRAAHAGAFCDVGDNRSALRFALERARCQGLDVYVRDCSLFGFPSFYVYVQQLSALSRLTPLRFALLFREWDSVRRTLFGFADASSEQVRHCARVLVDEATRCNPLLEHQFARTTLESPVAAALDFRPWLVLMLLEAGMQDEARRMLAQPPLEPPAPARAAVLDGLASLIPSYAVARGGKVRTEALRSSFSRAFGLADAGAHAAEPQTESPLRVPRCHSVYGCPACACRRLCYLDEWRRLAQHLRTRAATVDQAAWLERI
jgi:YcaO-like protein with predicted kinase domain